MTLDKKPTGDLPLFPPTINIKGRLYDFQTPRIMGIMNLTPDSFYAGSRIQSPERITTRVEEIRRQGGDIIDAGAYSTRPGGMDIPESEEWERLAPGLEIIRETWPEAIISVDTFRSDIPRKAVESFEADIINDVSGGDLDADMFATVAELKVPYVLTHMRGTPANMQSLTKYGDVSAEVLSDLAFKASRLRRLGVCDIILDPGFGFAKTIDQNYRLLSDLPEFVNTGLPVLVGVSRKSMIWRPLDILPEESLAGTISLNMAAMIKGASILRVHDVAEARQSAEVFALLKKNSRKETEKTSISSKFIDK